MATDPWSKFEEVTAPATGGIAPVYTAPAAPSKKAAEARAVQDQVLQEQSASRDAIRLQMAQAEEARKAREREQGVDATEGERKAGAFLIRALGSNADYEGAKVGARSLPGQMFQDAAPDLSNVLFNDADRQKSDAAQDEFIAASLRQDSGAAIPPDEMDRQRRIYFPMPGDGPEVLEQKRQARLRAIEGLRQSAGRLAASSEERFRQLQEQNGGTDRNQDERRDGTVPRGRDSASGNGGSGGPAPIPGVREPTQAEVFKDGVQWDIDKPDMMASADDYLARMGVGPGTEAEVNAFWNTNRGNQDLTVDGVREWYDRRGLGVNDADLAASIADAKAGKEFTGSGFEGMVSDYYERLDEALAKRGADPESAVGSAGTGAANALPFLDEFAGTVGGVKSSLQGGSFEDGYTSERDIFRREQDRAAEAHPYLNTGANIGMSMALSGPIFKDPARLAKAAQTARRIGDTARAEQLGRLAMQSAAKAGAGVGATYGFAEGEGLQDSLTGAGTGAALGAAAGAAVEAVAPAIQKVIARRPRAAGSAPTSAERYAQGQKFGMDLSPGDTGGMTPKIIERVLDVQPGSGSVMNAERQRLAGQIEDSVDNVAATFGPDTSFRGMGEAAQRGARGWMTRFQETAGKLYNAIPIKPDTATDLTNTRSALAELTDTFASNPALRNATRNTKLNQYREALDQGGLSWNDLKAFRSEVGEQLGEALLSDGTRKGQLKKLYAAMSQDMEATARAQGPRALRAFRKANDTYSAGQDRIEGVITSLIGKAGDNSPEAAAAFLQRVAKEGKGSADLKALADARRTLKSEEWAEVSNAFVRLLGQPANSAGREFNPATFIRSYNDMAPEAKNLLFGGQNKALRQNLDEFADVIGLVAGNNSTRNTSNTAMGLAGLGGLSAGGLPGLLAQTAGSFGAAKAWTNPGFVRWVTGYNRMLAKAAKNGGAISPSAHQGQMAALGRLAGSNAVIAQEAQGLQRQLTEMFESGPRALAAQPETQGGDRQGTSGETR